MKELNHWADQTADRVIRQKGDKHQYVCASGITPSGVVHIGNFRELITVDFVSRALRDMGKEVRFIFSWDDYDVFRKVPKNMPKPEVLETYLRKPICKTPDTFDCHESYAEHNERAMENSIKKVNVFPEFIYQSRKYRKADYTEEMKLALQKKKEIMEILDKYRAEALTENWFPISVFCSKCDRDETVIQEYKDEYFLSYECQSCGIKETVDLRSCGNAKLLWRIDWPARWAYEKVDFEPGGKDHSSEGGSYTTAKDISKIVYNFDPPVYLQYDFVSIKGRGGKISSSSGEVITLDDLLEIYEPQMVRWIFASYRPNTDFAISFDLDVIKNYEDYDRCERIFFKKEQVGEKRYSTEKRIYELSQLDKPLPEMAFQPTFRHLTNVLQIFSGDMKKAEDYYRNELKSEADLARFRTRAKCAWTWITKFAPEDFKFSLRNEATQIEMEESYREAFRELCELLRKSEKLEENPIYEGMYKIINAKNLDAKLFFNYAYQLLIAKEQGPKLASFLTIIGKGKLLELFSKN